MKNGHFTQVKWSYWLLPMGKNYKFLRVVAFTHVVVKYTEIMKNSWYDAIFYNDP